MAKNKDKNHPAVLALKAYQARRNINREVLAEEAGVGLVTINRLMSGDIPREDTLTKIAANLKIRLTDAYQAVAHPELGEYPRSWCDNLLGEYVSIRQNRWRDNHEVINTFPVTFEWCTEKPGLKMTWEFAIDAKTVKRQSAYVSMTSRDGSITIISNNSGTISSTHLQREDPSARRLFGLYSGFGQISKSQRAIVSQVVAYVRKDALDFEYDNQVWPKAAGHKQLCAILAEVKDDYGLLIHPPERQ